MRLSEREKQYVVILVIMVLLAGIYFFYTLAVEPYNLKKEELSAELAALEQQHVLQQAKLLQLEETKAEIQSKAKDAELLSEPFFPSLPQDRLLLLVQDLFMKSGISVNDITLSAPVISVPNLPTAISGAQTYRLKQLMETYQGKQPMPEEAVPDIQSDNINDGSVPRVDVTLSIQGTHEAILKFIKACEDMNRTLSVSMLKESVVDVSAEVEEDAGTGGATPGANASKGNIQAGLTMSFYAIDKPDGDAIFDWDATLTKTGGKLFQTMYQEEEPTNGELNP